MAYLPLPWHSLPLVLPSWKWWHIDGVRESLPCRIADASRFWEHLLSRPKCSFLRLVQNPLRSATEQTQQTDWWILRMHGGKSWTRPNQVFFFGQAIYMILWWYSRREKPCCHWATIAFESSDVFLALLCPKHWKVISHIGRTPDAGHYVYYNRHDMLFDQLGTRFCISIWKQSLQKTVHWFFILFTPLCCDKASCPQICFAGLRLVFGYVTMMTNASRFQPDFNVVDSKVSFARCMCCRSKPVKFLAHRRIHASDQTDERSQYRCRNTVAIAGLPGSIRQKHSCRIFPSAL